MVLIDWLNLLVLGLALGAQFLYRRSFCFSLGALSFKLNSQKNFKKLLIGLWVLSLIFIFGFIIRDSIWQYRIWQGSGVMKYVLPPYQNLAYFFSYVGTRFFAPWILALLASFLVSRAAKFFNRRFGERFFEPEEIELIALGVFLTGYPGFLIYLLMIFLFAVLFSAGYTLFSKGRLPLYYFWLPLAIFAMIVEYWLIPRLGFSSLMSQFILGDFTKMIFGF